MRLHHVIDGRDDAAVLVLGPSLGSTVEMWDRVLPGLTDQLRVVRYDHRGHGGSPTTPGPYRIDDLGGDVVELLDELGVERAHLGGLSLGGIIAMWVAANHPERVDRLTLMCTSPHLPPASGWLDRAATVRAEGTAAVAPAVVGRWLTPDYAAVHPDEVERLKAMIASTDDESYAACCEAVAEVDLRSQLGAIEALTLIIAGAEDPATPPDHSHAIAHEISGAQVEVLSPAAHLAAWERPDEVTTLLLGHLFVGGAG